MKTKSNPEGRNWPDEIVLDVGNKRAAAFYRDQLELICKDSRKTKARRLAESALMFWDQLQIEAAKREKAANDGTQVPDSGARS